MRHDHMIPRAGEPAPFHFEDRWTVEACPAAVWAVLEQVDAWPQWWPGLAAAERIGANPSGADQSVRPVTSGSRARLLVRAPIGRSLRFSIEVVDVEAPHSIRFRSDGDLRGEGCWTLTSTKSQTVIDALWCVTTSRPIIRAMRPLSGLMHGVVMTAGERALRARLTEPSGD